MYQIYIFHTNLSASLIVMSMYSCADILTTFTFLEVHEVLGNPVTIGDIVTTAAPLPFTVCRHILWNTKR